MKNKKKIIGFVIIGLILIGFIIFSCTYDFSDSHLRVEGIRVYVSDYALTVDGCNEDVSNIAYCEKTMEVNDEEVTLIFEFKNFRENGYPSSIVASVNGNVFYERDDLNIEELGSIDYQIFLNFNVIDDYIVFTFTNGTAGRTTTLYAIDVDGNIILEETEIDDDDMLIKDYADFITYEDNVITLYATRIVEDINYNGSSICNADDDEIVEAYYTYALKDGKFKKKQISTITAAEFIENKGIICTNKD